MYERISPGELRKLEWVGAEHATVGPERIPPTSIAGIPRIVYENGWLDDSPRILASVQTRSLTASLTSHRERLNNAPEPRVRETRAAARTGAAIVTALMSSTAAVPKRSQRVEKSIPGVVIGSTGYKKGAFEEHAMGVRVEFDRNRLDGDGVETVRGIIVSLTQNGYRNVLVDGEHDTHPYRPAQLRVLGAQLEEKHNDDDDDDEYASRQQRRSSPRNSSLGQQKTFSQPPPPPPPVSKPKPPKIEDGARVRVWHYSDDGEEEAKFGTIEYSACGYRYVKFDGEDTLKPCRPSHLEAVMSSSPRVQSRVVDPAAWKTDLAVGNRVELILAPGGTREAGQKKKRRFGRVQRVSANGCRWVLVEGEGPDMIPTRPHQLRLVVEAPERDILAEMADKPKNTALLPAERTQLCKEDISVIHNSLVLGSRVVVDYDPSKSFAKQNVGTITRVKHGFRYVEHQKAKKEEPIRPIRLTLVEDVTDEPVPTVFPQAMSDDSDIDIESRAEEEVDGGDSGSDISIDERVEARSATGTWEKGTARRKRRDSRLLYVTLDGEEIARPYRKENVRSLDEDDFYDTGKKSTGWVSKYPEYVMGATCRVNTTGMVGIVTKITANGYRYIQPDVGQAKPYRPADLTVVAPPAADYRPPQPPQPPQRRHERRDDIKREESPPRKRPKTAHRYVGPLPLPTTYTLGARVIAKWAKENGVFYATITALHPSIGAVDLDYDDGDYWERAPAAMVIQVLTNN